MAIRNWTTGQFVTCCIASALAWVAVFLINKASRPPTIRFVGITRETPMAQYVIHDISTVLLFLIPVVPLIIAWRWFSRQPLE
jgi:hypothetical protein